MKRQDIMCVQQTCHALYGQRGLDHQSCRLYNPGPFPDMHPEVDRITVHAAANYTSRVVHVHVADQFLSFINDFLVFDSFQSKRLERNELLLAADARHSSVLVLLSSVGVESRSSSTRPAGPVIGPVPHTISCCHEDMSKEQGTSRGDQEVRTS